MTFNRSLKKDRAAPTLNNGASGAWLPWIFLLFGIAIMYVPSMIDLFRGAWSSDQNAHGPIVMGMAFYFLYFRARLLLINGQLKPTPSIGLGSVILLFGLILYTLGRSQGVLTFELGSLIIVLSGLVVAMFGVQTWRQMWFAFFFMLFMIPLPGTVVDAITLPMKIAVSYAAEHVLYWAGYPVARSGVVLAIGQYQLLVANACAGLNSLLTLEAMGLLYMNLVRHPSVRRNVILAALIIPISFTANTMRILSLGLITYYYGDAAGQGFLHSFSGVLMFLCALMLVFAVDSLLGRLLKDSRHAKSTVRKIKLKHPSLFEFLRKRAAVNVTFAALIVTAMLISTVSAHVLFPVVTNSKPNIALDKLVSGSFGDWKEIPSVMVQASITDTVEGSTDFDQPYDAILMRTYANKNGDQVMLALAYAKDQRQDVKIHFPEACYRASGFKVTDLTAINLSLGRAASTDGKINPIPAKQMLATSNDRSEAVTYWVRVGDDYAQSGWQARVKIFRDGLTGKTVDGILVRASMQLANQNDATKTYAIEQSFLRQLVQQIRPEQADVVLAGRQ